MTSKNSLPSPTSDSPQNPQFSAKREPLPDVLPDFVSTLSREQVETVSLESLTLIHSKVTPEAWNLFLTDLSHTTAKRQWKRVRNRILQKVHAKEQGIESKHKRRKQKTSSNSNKLSRNKMQELHAQLFHRMKLAHDWNERLFVTIDCDYDSYMTPMELRSLASQLSHTYSTNAKLKNDSWYLTFCGISDTFHSVNLRQNSGFDSWQVDLQRGKLLEALWNMDQHFRARKEYHTTHPAPRFNPREHKQPHLDEYFIEQQTFEEQHVTPFSNEAASSEQFTELKKRVVYLTADSPNVIDELQPGTMYVIGGIVDRNRNKNLCYERAQELGVEHARFPIEEFIGEELSTSTVMTVNQCFELMAAKQELNSWKEAVLKVFPPRKRKRQEMMEEQEEQESKKQKTEEDNTLESAQT